MGDTTDQKFSLLCNFPLWYVLKTERQQILFYLSLLGTAFCFDSCVNYFEVLPTMYKVPFFYTTSQLFTTFEDDR